MPRSLSSLLPPLSLLNKLSRSLLNLSSQLRRSRHLLPPPNKLLSLRSRPNRRSQSLLSLNQTRKTMRKITMMKMMKMLMI